MNTFSHSSDGVKFPRTGNFIEHGNGDYIAASSQVIKKGYALTMSATGFLEIAEVADRVFAIALVALSTDSDNQSNVEKQVGPAIHIVESHVDYEMRANADLVQADLLDHFDLIIVDGVQLVDKTGGAVTTAADQVVQVRRIGVNGDPRACIVRFITR